MITFRIRFAPFVLLATLAASAFITVARAAPERPSAPGDPMPTRVLDPDTGLATFTTPPIDLQAPPYLFRVVASFSINDAVPHRPDKVRFTILRTGAREKWKSGELITLRTPTQRMFWESTVGTADEDGSTMETATADIDTSFFMGLVKEDSVSVEIGKMKGTLDKNWLRPLKELVKKIPGG